MPHDLRRGGPSGELISAPRWCEVGVPRRPEGESPFPCGDRHVLRSQRRPSRDVPGRLDRNSGRHRAVGGPARTAATTLRRRRLTGPEATGRSRNRNQHNRCAASGADAWRHAAGPREAVGESRSGRQGNQPAQSLLAGWRRENQEPGCRAARARRRRGHGVSPGRVGARRSCCSHAAQRFSPVRDRHAESRKRTRLEERCRGRAARRARRRVRFHRSCDRLDR